MSDLDWDLSVYCRISGYNSQVNSALHPSGVAKSSTSFGWGKGGKVTSAGWQVTLCDLIWHVISRSGVIISITNCYIRFTLLYSVLRPLPLHVGHKDDRSPISPGPPSTLRRLC